MTSNVVNRSSMASQPRPESSCSKDVIDCSGRPRFMNCRALAGMPYEPTEMEHIANVVTHALWIAPSLAGLLWMLHVSVTQLQSVTAVVYGMALLLLFTTSSTFHLISYSGSVGIVKNFFHIGDRAVIYLFIAASYTPWLLLHDVSGWGRTMMWTVWMAAAAGIAYQYTFHERYKQLETFFYVVIGVCPAVFVITMQDVAGLQELALGGVVYMLGVIFFKCDGLIPFAHAIWHCFVFVGAVMHFCAVSKHLFGRSDLNSSLGVTYESS